MKIIVVGAGDVGHYLCQVLSEDGHAVTVIEADDAIADDIEDSLDVRVIRGNGASAKTLSIAGAADCDFLMAMTAHDQLNIVSCAIGKKLGAKTTIGRIHDQFYTDNSIINYQKYFNVDILINPEALTAVELAKHVRNPERVAVEDFVRGQIELQEVVISEGSRVAGKTLREIKLGDGLKVGYLERGDTLSVPTANTILAPGDKITILGTPDLLLRARSMFTNESMAGTVRIVISGATETTISLIRRLTHYRFKLRVIEPDLKKCKELAENFPAVTVINGSAASLRLMEEEQIGSADYFIACTKDDEENVMTGLQAKKLGVKNIELVINKPDYEQVLQNISSLIDLSSVASPRKVTALEIKRYVTNKDYAIIGSLKGDTIVFLEIRVRSDSESAGKKIMDLKLPTACIIAALVDEQGVAKVPGAQDVVNADDRMVVILERDNIGEVVDMFVK